MKLYSLLQHSKKSFLNKSNVRNLMRKLQIRNQKRSQGFSVQPLEKFELQKANINLSDSSLLTQIKKTYHRKENKKLEKDKEILPSDGETASGQMTPEELSSRVLDRFQVSLVTSSY